MPTANPAQLCEDDAHKLDTLMRLAAQNQWYDVAKTLQAARNLLRKRIADAASEDLLNAIKPE